MNLLFLTPQLPYPPRQGTAIRNWGLIHHLAARHSLSLLSFLEPGQTADWPELRAACRRILTVPVPPRSRADRLRTLLSGWPDLARRLMSPEFSRALRQLLAQAEFDWVQIEGLEMVPYLPEVRRGAPRARVLYDAHNAEHVIQQRAFAADLRQPARWAAAAYSWLQAPRLRRYEAAVCRQVDRVACVSEIDARSLQRLAPGLQPVVVPNGLDLDSYVPAPAVVAPRLVFTGKMDYRPNVDAALWFAGEILPRIRARRPEAEFMVVGQKPPPALLALSGTRGLTVTGAVEDVRPYIAAAAVYVAPLRMGGGTRFKLLEAMALARPVVATRIGAEGFDPAAGDALRLADRPEEFAARVLELLEAPAEASALGQRGRAFARAYDWRAIVPRLEAVY